MFFSENFENKLKYKQVKFSGVSATLTKDSPIEKAAIAEVGFVIDLFPEHEKVFQQIDSPGAALEWILKKEEEKFAIIFLGDAENVKKNALIDLAEPFNASGTVVISKLGRYFVT